MIIPVLFFCLLPGCTDPWSVANPYQGTQVDGSQGLYTTEVPNPPVTRQPRVGTFAISI